MVKFYAVKVGRQKGVYTSWDDCKHQVQGFSGAIFKGFACMEDAQKFIGSERSERKETFDFTVYTDGSYSNGYAGGSAVVVEKKQIYCDFVKTNPTNNRGELLGIILALQNTHGSVLIRTDSLYCIQVVANPTKTNLDMIHTIHELMKEKVKVKFEHVKAHSGIYFNEMADEFAGKKVEQLTVFNFS